MAKRPGTNAEVRALEAGGVLNPHPERVKDEVFLRNDFFDSRDLLQVKYEMLRRVRLEGQQITRSAVTFGFSRPAFYQAKDAFEAEGLSGLLPRRRGPKEGHKLNETVMAFVEKALEEDAALQPVDLVKMIWEAFDVRVHPRSIERALNRRQKKRQRGKSK